MSDLSSYPLGTNNPDVFMKNVENEDEFVNSPANSFTDRFGLERFTIAGFESFAADQRVNFESRFSTSLEDQENRFSLFLASSGYDRVGEYAAGISLTEYNQIFHYQNQWWRAAATTELPYTTTGDWATESNKFVGVGEGLLRQELYSTSGSSMIRNEKGETVQEHMTKSDFATNKLQSFNKSTQKTTLIAHRGFARIAPENTVEAWTIATQLGCTQLECDVGFTSDNVCVVLHDNNLKRTTGYDANIGDTPYSVVSGLDAGSFFSPYFSGAKVPTLRSMLLAVAGKTEKVWVELKGSATNAQIDIFLSIVEECGFLDIINVQSFDWDVLRRVRLKNKEIEVGPLISTYDPSHVDQVSALAPAVYLVAHAALTQHATIFNAFYDAGISVGTWTVNDLQLLKKCNQNGIKYIMSDFTLF